MTPDELDHPASQPPPGGQSPSEPPPGEPPPGEPPAAELPSAEPLAAAAGEPVEPGSAAAVSAAPSGAGRPGKRERWAIAGLVALLIVVLSAVGLFALVGASSSSIVAGWAPADAIVYFEVRGDLPGDQRQNLGTFLARFPGFADQSTLDDKLAETLDRLIGNATGDKHDYSTEIKPWFGGQVGMSLSAFPSNTTTGTGTRALLVAIQKDPAAAAAWIGSLGGPQPTVEAYGSATLQVVGSGGTDRFAYTAANGVLLIGDVDSVKAAIDRNGANGLAAADGFKAATAKIGGDQLTRTYLDLRRYWEGLSAALGQEGVPSLGLSQTLLDRLPAWLAAGGRLESDALVLRSIVPHVEGAPTRENRAGAIASKLPASTIALVETHDYGAGLKDALDQLRADPTLAPGLEQVEQAASVLGGLDRLIGWIGDAGIAVVGDGATPTGGIVVVPADASQAEQLFTSIKNLVALGGGSAGVALREEQFEDGTITTVDLGDLQRLLGSSGGATVLPVPIGGHVELSFSVQRGLAVVGIGPDFVKSVLTVTPGSSLADQERYKSAIDRVGSRNVSSFFVDLAAIRGRAERLVAAAPNGASYGTEIKPYLEPFDLLVGAAVTGSSDDTSTVIVTVTKP